MEWRDWGCSGGGEVLKSLEIPLPMRFPPRFRFAFTPFFRPYARLPWPRWFWLSAPKALAQGVSAEATPAAQPAYSSSDAPTESTASLAGGGTEQPHRMAHPYIGPPSAFSRIAVGVNVSPLGIGVEAATNINRHLNLRANGSLFQYTADGISTEGFNVTAKIKMSSARASLDYYPFHAGFRLSPGIMFYNGNHANVTFIAASGTSFSLDNHTYYSASGANAVVGQGGFGLGNGRPAFTMTTGWGNVIPASGRHWSFPFEIGVALIQAAFCRAEPVGLCLRFEWRELRQCGDRFDGAGRPCGAGEELSERFRRAQDVSHCLVWGGLQLQDAQPVGWAHRNPCQTKCNPRRQCGNPCWTKCNRC